jgi:hypothetical protein
MQIVIDNKIQILDAPGEFIATVKERLTFPNPKWIENNKRGYWNGKTPKQLKCYEQIDNGLIIPRGFIRHLIGIAKAQGIRYHAGPETHLAGARLYFQGQAQPFQEIAVQDILGQDFVTLSAPTGSGKACRLCIR